MLKILVWYSAGPLRIQSADDRDEESTLTTDTQRKGTKYIG